MKLAQAVLHAKTDAGRGTVSITATGAAARMVKIDIPQGNVRMSDNFFDLVPGETVTIHLRQADGEALLLDGLKNDFAAVSSSR